MLTGLGPIGARDQNNDPDPVSTVVARRQAATTTFVSVLLPGDDGTSTVTAVPALRSGVPVGAAEALGLQIRTPGGSYSLFVALGHDAYQIGGRALDGGMVLVERTGEGGLQAEQAALA